jgi:5'-nucleotidase
MSGSVAGQRQVVATNDDGIDSGGLHVLARTLTAAGFVVVVVAPDSNMSGVSRSATYRDPVILEARESDIADRVYACLGSPVDCVRVALLSDVAPDADLVISGINSGPNLGDDTLSSGTVGAAIEAALLGVPAFAISQQPHPNHFHIVDTQERTTEYETAAKVAAAFASAVCAARAPERAILNVNVPAAPDGTVALTRLGRRYYARGSLTPVDRDGVRGYLTFGDPEGPPPPYEHEVGTDFAAITEGLISATPISYAWHQQDGWSAVLEWCEAVCRRVEALLPESLLGAG